MQVNRLSSKVSRFVPAKFLTSRSEPRVTFQRNILGVEVDEGGSG